VVPVSSPLRFIYSSRAAAFFPSPIFSRPSLASVACDVSGGVARRRFSPCCALLRLLQGLWRRQRRGAAIGGRACCCCVVAAAAPPPSSLRAGTAALGSRVGCFCVGAAAALPPPSARAGLSSSFELHLSAGVRWSFASILVSSSVNASSFI